MENQLVSRHCLLACDRAPVLGAHFSDRII